MPMTKTEYIQLFGKGSQNVALYELKQALKEVYNWLHIRGVMICMLPKHCFASPEFKKATQFSLSLKAYKTYLKFDTVVCRTFR